MLKVSFLCVLRVTLTTFGGFVTSIGEFNCYSCVGTPLNQNGCGKYFTAKTVRREECRHGYCYIQKDTTGRTLRGCTTAEWCRENDNGITTNCCYENLCNTAAQAKSSLTIVVMLLTIMALKF